MVLLPHFVLNRIFHLIYHKYISKFRGVRLCFLQNLFGKWPIVFANSVCPDQTLRSVRLIWACTVCQLPVLGFRYKMG